MKTFVALTVAFTKDQTRAELVNISKVYRIIEKGNGCVLCFNSTGSDSIEVKESKSAVEKLLN